MNTLEQTTKSSSNSLELVNIRNIFYLTNYKMLIIANLLAVLCLGLFIKFYYYQQQITSGPRYFPGTPDGVLIELPPLNINHLKLNGLLTNNKGFLIDQPKININQLGPDQDNALILYWVKQVITTIFDYDYVNYRGALQNMRNYFAPGAHELFMRALSDSKNLETIKNSKRIVRSEIIAEPVVKNEGILNERYVWQVFVPIDLYYENITDEPLVQQVTAKLWVFRVSTLQSPFFGLSIFLINLEPRVESDPGE